MNQNNFKLYSYRYKRTRIYPIHPLLYNIIYNETYFLDYSPIDGNYKLNQSGSQVFIEKNWPNQRFFVVSLEL